MPPETAASVTLERRVSGEKLAESSKENIPLGY